MVKFFRNSVGSAYRSRGQGMTEYIIIVALIAVAAIGVYNLFGKTVRNQTAAIAQGLAGNDTASKNASNAAKQTANDASSVANQTRGLKDFGKDSGDK
jgi:Flp pilus assembly pilin Flp